MTGNKGNEERVRLVVMGKTGSGKSSLVNALLGKKSRFKCGGLGNSVSTTTEADEGYCKGSAVKVVDTPGYSDTRVSEEDNNKEIRRCLMLIRTRFTEEDVETFRKVKMRFGDSFRDYTVIVFTNKEQLDEDEITEKEYIEHQAPLNLKDILKEVRRDPVFINSKSTNLESELHPLSTLIKGVKLDSFYTDVKYRSSIETLKRLVEVKRKCKEAYTEWKNKREDVLDCFSKFEFYLNSMVTNVRISNMAGSVAGIVGTVMTVIGVIAAPLTFGTSLIVTAVGAGIGIAGGVTGGGATAAEFFMSQKRKNEMDALLKEDRELVEKLDDEKGKCGKLLTEIFHNNEIKTVIQSVLKKSIALSNNNKVFEEAVAKGHDEAREYLLQFLNAEKKNLEPDEMDTGHDTSLGAANAAATAGGQVAKTVAVATDATTDIVGSVAASTVTAVKVTAIAGLALSVITLPLDVYTIFRSSSDLHSNKARHLETFIINLTKKLKMNIKDYEEDREVLNIFVDEVANFIDSEK